MLATTAIELLPRAAVLGVVEVPHAFLSLGLPYAFSLGRQWLGSEGVRGVAVPAGAQRTRGALRIDDDHVALGLGLGVRVRLRIRVRVRVRCRAA